MSLSVEQIIFPYKRLCKMRQVWPVQSWSSECSQRGRTRIFLRIVIEITRDFYDTKLFVFLLLQTAMVTPVFFHLLLLLLLTSCLRQLRIDCVTSHALSCLRLFFQYLWYFVGNVNPCRESYSYFSFDDSYFFVREWCY